MCKVCTEAVHCIAFWKRTLSQVKTSPQKHKKHTKNTTTPPQKTPPQKHHNKNTTKTQPLHHKKTPPQKHHHKKHHHKKNTTKNTTTKNTTTKTPTEKTPPQEKKTPPQEHHKNTTTRTPQKHHHTTIKHHHTTTTKTPPHHHKNTTTKTPPQEHHHKNTTKNITTKNTTTKNTTTKNTTTKTPTEKTPPQKKNTTTRTPPQKHNHKNITTKTPPQKHHHTTTKTPPQYYSSTTLYYKVLQSTAPVVLKVLLCTTKYYSVLQSTIPVLLCTTLYYKVLLQYYPVLEVLLQYYSATTKCYSSTTPVQKKLPKWSFRARGLQISQKKLPKRAFRAKLPTIFTEEGSKMIVSCEASSKFHRKSFQNERFVRSFRQFSQKKVPKWSFRARLHPNFTKEGSKTSVSREAASKFHRKNFQNERFVRSFRQFSQKKVPKWSFCARLLQNFTEKASKTSVSCEASYNFHRRRFQNDRFVRSFRQFSRKKHPKGSFRAMLPTIFTEKTSKRIVSRDASDNFHRKNFQKDRKLKMEKNSPKKWKKNPRKVLDPN